MMVRDIAAIEAEAADRARAEVPAGTRLVPVTEDADTLFFGRAENGDLLTWEWGEPDEHGWYEPTITSHADDNLRDRARAEVLAQVEGLRVLSEAATPGPWKQTGTKAKPHWYVSAPDVLVHGPRMDATDMAPETYARWNADAALIAAAVNLVRSLSQPVASEEE